MRTSPLSLAILYFFIGVAFTYFGIRSINDSGWGIFTVLIALFATMDFAYSFRFFLLHIRIKKAKNGKK